jgi:hypothetical protein
MNNTREVPWKRLLAEGAAIVVSILLAFAIDAWWQDRSDQIRLNEYLGQIRADMLENERRLVEALQLEQAQLSAVEAILAALRNPEPMTLQSAREWTQFEPGFLWYSDPRLLEGALNALVATGEINLVKDPRVKTSLIKYLAQFKADWNEFDRNVSQYLSHKDELARILELARTPNIEPGKDERAHELFSIQEDKTAAVVFRLLQKNITNRIWYLEQMLTATEELSQELQTRESKVPSLPDPNG